MNIPIPSYDIAVISGDLVEVQIGQNIFVIAEPSIIDDAVFELDILERSIQEFEKYTGVPYVWGSYKIAILLPNYPMGAMEHPLLTTATPFILVGDKSMVWMANHEVSHSWTGNLVTCMNFDNLWLNEGFDVFVERKISKILYGEAVTKMTSKIWN